MTTPGHRKHHTTGHGKRHEPKPPDNPCDPGKKRFFDNKALYEDMASKLNTDTDFLMALSSFESGWLNDHNANLHNLFGVTHAGGKNLHYTSFQAAAEDWIQRYGTYVEGTKTIEAFVAGLRKVPPHGYNTVNPDYDDEVIRQVNTVKKYKGICKVE
jgi:hypothetical protein